ncbi:MAG: HNH endonuclease, partial [Thermoanaerobaculia bacterium]
VVVHVDEEVLKDPTQSGVSMLEDGTDVSAETSRRLGCDTGKVVMQRDSEGKILDVGRRTRTIPTAIRRALTARDEGCQFPGCGLKYCEAHHLKHWANGGKTSLDNLVLLCRRHHRAVHEEGYQIEHASNGELRFLRPEGWEIPTVPPPTRLFRDPLEELSTLLVEEGVSIDASTGFPTWDGGRLDLNWAIQGYRQL